MSSLAGPQGLFAPLPTLKGETVQTGPSQPIDMPRKKKRSGGGNKKGTSAERRATHNAVERARRESLNTRFLQLAANLPATAAVRRPSKSLIVNKSLAFVAEALTRETMYRSKIQELAQESDSLRDELNALRVQSGLSPRLQSIDRSLPAPMADGSFDQNRRECMAQLAADGHDLDFHSWELDNEDGESISDAGQQTDSRTSNFDSPYLAASLEASSAPPAASNPFQQHFATLQPDDATFRRHSAAGTYGMPASSSGLEQPLDTVSFSPFGLPPASLPSRSSLSSLQTGRPSSLSAPQAPLPSTREEYEFPPVTPTTALVFNQLLAGFDASQLGTGASSLAPSSQPQQQQYAASSAAGPFTTHQHSMLAPQTHAFHAPQA